MRVADAAHLQLAAFKNKYKLLFSKDALIKSDTFIMWQKSFWILDLSKDPKNALKFP